MDTYWDSADIRPLKLMNRDNSAAAQEPVTSAAKRAELVSEGGAIKLTSLAGAVFAHKDHKKGQQDTFRIFFERERVVPRRRRKNLPVCCHSACS